MKPLNIVSMLDAPIRLNGKMKGVICCEHVGDIRQWTANEENFAGNICDIISRAMLAKERLVALKQLASMNANLEQLVLERTIELEDQRARVVHSSKMAVLGEMAGAIAHEINNPLAIIIGSTKILELMKASGDLGKENFDEILKDIAVTCLRIEKIVNGLRFFARDASNDRPEIVQVQRILEDSFALCQEKFASHGCRLESEFESTDPLLINCSPVSISQALLNLLSNACDAVDTTEDKWIKVKCSGDQTHVKICVIDSGSGISPGDRGKILKQSFTTKPIGKGTGLGLPIAKGIVEQHGGSLSLDLESPYTTFVLMLPRVFA